MFLVNGVLQTVNFNRQEVEKVVQELIQNNMKLSLSNGHHFLRKECYDKLLFSGERKVFATPIATQIHHGKRSLIDEDKDTQRKKDKQKRIIDVMTKDVMAKDTRRKRDKQRTIMKENRKESQIKNVSFTTSNLEGFDEDSEQL